jgi:hypothetical protein
MRFRTQEDLLAIRCDLVILTHVHVGFDLGDARRIGDQESPIKAVVQLVSSHVVKPFGVTQ